MESFKTSFLDWNAQEKGCCSNDVGTPSPGKAKKSLQWQSMFLRLLGDTMRSLHVASRQSIKGLDLPLCPLPPSCRLHKSFSALETQPQCLLHQLENKVFHLWCVWWRWRKSVRDEQKSKSVLLMLMNCWLSKCCSLHFFSGNYSFLDGETISSFTPLQMLKNITHVSKPAFCCVFFYSF